MFAHLTPFSNEILDDSDPSITSALQGHLLKTLALKPDVGFLEGSCTAPLDPRAQDVVGIQTVSAGANGATRRSTSSPMPSRRLKP